MWTKDREFPAATTATSGGRSSSSRGASSSSSASGTSSKATSLTMRAAAVRFVLANHLVSSAVLGPRTVEQLEQLVARDRQRPDVFARTQTSACRARSRAWGSRRDSRSTERKRSTACSTSPAKRPPAHPRDLRAGPFAVEYKGGDDPGDAAPTARPTRSSARGSPRRTRACPSWPRRATRRPSPAWPARPLRGSSTRSTARASSSRATASSPS